MKTVLLAAALVAAAFSAQALERSTPDAEVSMQQLMDEIKAAAQRPHTDQCDGTLRWHMGALVLMNNRAEGICVIGKADQIRVLQQCQVGRHCFVTGLARLCKDAGECVEINHVTKAIQR